MQILVHGIDWALGSVTEDTFSCLEDFARDNSDHTALFATGLDGLQNMTAEQFMEGSAVGQELYNCMTEEESPLVQLAVTEALAAQLC